MANYTGIQGQNILIVDTDPANPTEGQIWYNSTSNLLKGYQFTPDVWVSGGNMGSSRYGTSAAGTATATLAIGGYGGSPGNYLTAVEKYNGTTWSPTGSLNQSSNFGGAGFGTQTAAVAVAGFQQPISPANLNFTENFNGSTWAISPAVLSTGRQNGAGVAGTQTLAIVFGSGPAGALTNTTEVFTSGGFSTKTITTS